MITLPSQDEMYQAVLRRDSAFDGLFFTGVKTTSIFCRPTCPAKKPKPESTEFFATAREAMLAGYRACKRCKPMDVHAKPPEWVEQLIDRVDAAPSQRIKSADLRQMSIEPARALRWFKQHYGMTFQAYHRARRMGLALAAVRNGRELNAVGLRHGFESASGFRDAFARAFGEPPGRASSNGISCLLSKWIDTPLGAMLAVANDEGLCLLEFVDRRGLETQLTILRRRFHAAVVPGDHEHLDLITEELLRYFDGSLKRFEVPIALRGSEFQIQVWKRLMQIPYGETMSYAQMARDIGRPDAQRAVGKANGDNRLALIIPCHRVVRADGTLCGYGGGLWRKRWLLEHERQRLR